jgi:hypothetical protein
LNSLTARRTLAIGAVEIAGEAKRCGGGLDVFTMGATDGFCDAVIALPMLLGRKFRTRPGIVRETTRPTPLRVLLTTLRIDDLANCE